MTEMGIKVPVLNNMALCLQRQGHSERAVQMLDQVIEIDEFNSKAHARKLQYLFDSGNLDELRKALRPIRLTPSCFDEFVRQTASKLERSLEQQTKKDAEITKKMFSKPLYDDKPQPELASELSPVEQERADEALYLAELSNFHWVVYPFFKTIEVLCDKMFGCKRSALKVNEEIKERRDRE